MIDSTNFYRYIRDYFKPIQTLIGVPFMVGGGAICDLVAFGHVTNDFDIYFRSYEDLTAFEARITKLGYKYTSETEFGRQYDLSNIRFDVITWEVKTPAEFVSLGEFTVNSMMLDGDVLYHVQDSIQDCMYKRLIPVRDSTTQYSFRIKRYMEKGFRVYIDPLLVDIFADKLVEPQVLPTMPIIRVDLSQY
jgi:hypothetical protein